ncbi:hypothetical protein BDW68DRAFT_174047 [Aspergillus falconensis]
MDDFPLTIAEVYQTFVKVLEETPGFGADMTRYLRHAASDKRTSQDLGWKKQSWREPSSWGTWGDQDQDVVSDALEKDRGGGDGDDGESDRWGV